jgi:hypothetical protein
MPKADVSVASKIAHNAREYDNIIKKNIFTGIERQPPQTPSDYNEILKNVRVTQVSNNGRRWEAFLLDVWDGRDEYKVNVEIVPEFSIVDKEDKPILSGKAVLIEERTLVFAANGKYYKVHTGDYFYPAINNPLKDSEIKDLKLPPLDKKVEAEKPATPVATDKKSAPD